MMLDKKVTEFLDVLSSNEPVPGGGGASATVGAMGVALGIMVGNLTLGKRKYADVEPDIKELIEKSQSLMDELKHLTDEDARVFEPLSRAYGLPRGTEEEKAAREAVMEHALLEASLVGALFVRAALEGASLNIFINTKLMKDRTQAEDLNARTEELIDKGRALSDKVYGAVLKHIK